MKKRVVYTAVFGGYDLLEEPKTVCPDLDYVVFTDEPLYSDTWKVVRTKILQGSHPSKRSRFFKILPHVVVAEYNESLWMDGNVHLVGRTSELFEKYADSVYVCCPKEHVVIDGMPKEDIYGEAKHCINLKKDDPGAIERHIDRCRKEGHPQRFGLWQNMCILRKHHDPAVSSLCNTWWCEYVHGCLRDQISFPHAVFKRCGPVPETFSETDLSRHFIRYGHKKQ